MAVANERLRRAPLLPPLPDRLGQGFEQRGDALRTTQHGRDLLIDDDGLERTSSPFGILATRTAAIHDGRPRIDTTGRAVDGRKSMSEYQCYEFVALDRQLTAKQMTELRAISTRAEITPTRFWNEYEWGDLKADSAKLLERYFDAHL